MKWTGKLVGGALGMAFGPVGAALGMLAGHLYDEKTAGAGDDAGRLPRDDVDGSVPPSGARPSGMGEGRARRRNGTAADRDPRVAAYQDSAPRGEAAPVADRFFCCTFEVMGHVAKADGRVSNQEIQAARAVMADFNLNDAQVAAAIAHFTTGKQTGYDLSHAIMALRSACAGRPDLLRVFLEIQMRAAIAGTDLRGPARPLLTKIAAMLGVGGIEFAHLEAVLRLRHGWAGARGGSGAGSAAGERNDAQSRVRLEQAYEVLEIAATASDEEVAKAYRRQLSRHHPDKLKANGLPESMLEHAKRRTQQIIEAWDLVRERRGLP
jgi:DnaJ like chaperone protein